MTSFLPIFCIFYILIELQIVHAVELLTFSLVLCNWLELDLGLKVALAGLLL
jgi:hypothetical protein